MLHFSRMKSLINPSTLSKPTPFAPLLFSLATKSICFYANPTTLLNPVPLPLKPLTLSPKPSFFRCLQSRASSQSPPSPSPGQTHVIVGPMFAGKTTTLLRRVQAETSDGRSVAIVKPNKDTRYGLDSIVTHDGVKLPCWVSSFRQKIGPEAYDKLDVIGIDELQFFEDLYDFCREAADHDGKLLYLLVWMVTI